MLAFEIDKNKGKLVVTKEPVAIACSTQLVYDVTKKHYNCGHVFEKVDVQYMTLYHMSDGSIQEEYPKYQKLVNNNNRPLHLMWYKGFLPTLDEIHVGKSQKNKVKKKKASIENITKKCLCYGCEQAKQHKNTIVNHGLSAFNKCVGIDNVFKRLDDIMKNPQWEVCCSSKDIFCGDIGIAGTGNVVSYFPVDVHSEINSTGKRTVKERFLKIALENGDYCGHDELFVKSIKPLYIWCDRFYFDSLEEKEKKEIITKTKELKLNLAIISYLKNKYVNNLSYETYGVTDIYCNDNYYHYDKPQEIDNIINALVYNITQEQMNIFIAQVNKRKNADGSIDYNQVFKAARAALYTQQQVTINELKQFINIMVKNGHLRFTKSKGGFINFYI